MRDYEKILLSYTEEMGSIDGMKPPFLEVKFEYDNDVKKAEALAGFQFPLDLKHYIEKLPKFDFSFTYKEGSVLISARNELLFAEEMKKELDKTIKQHPFIKKKLSKFKNLLLISYTGSFHSVLAEVTEKETILHLMIPDGTTYKMDVTLNEYHDFLLLTRGLYLGEAYLCPHFPQRLLVDDYDGFYHNMELLFNITPDKLPMCYHKELVKDAVPSYLQFGKSYYEEFKRLFEKEIEAGTCTIDPALNALDTDRMNYIWVPRIIELNIGTRLPAAYRQLQYEYGKTGLRFTRTARDGRFISIQFLHASTEVFWNKEEKAYTLDANLYLFGEKGKVPDFDGIRLFAISAEYKLGMYILEEDNIEIVMVDSVENMRLVEMPEHIRTMEGFMNRFLETKGEFLLDEIPV